MESFKAELPGCDVAPPIIATKLNKNAKQIRPMTASELG